MADKPMTGLQKVALLLKSLPRETVAKVLAHMNPRQGAILTNELSKIDNDPTLSEKLPNVVDEAVKMLGDTARSKQEPAPRPRTAPVPPTPTRSVSEGPPIPEKSQSSVDTLVDIKIDDELAAKKMGPPSPAVADMPSAGADPLPALASVPAELLAAALESETARTIFILMEKLPVNLAAQIYKLLSPAKRKEISLRFAEKSTVSEHIVKQIAQGVLKKCQALRSSTASATAGEEREKLMATMIKGLERNERMEMLEMLGQTDPGLTERVKNLLYEFEVIARMENSTVQKLLAEVNMQALALALRGAPGEVEERLMANLSKRAQENLREEMSLIGNATPAKVQEARQTIVQTIQQLDQRGEFVLRE